MENMLHTKKFTLQISSYVYFSFREEKRHPPHLHLYTWEVNRARVETPEFEFLFSLRRLELVAPSSPECTQCTRPRMEQCGEAGREMQELSPCSRSSLKVCFVQVFSVSDSNQKHFASLCSEVQRRSVLSSGLLLLSYNHSCYNLSPDVYTCQSCRSSCASTKPAGAFLLHSPSVLPIAASGVRAQAAQQAAGRQSCSLTAAGSEEQAEQGKERKGRAFRGQ